MANHPHLSPCKHGSYRAAEPKHSTQLCFLSLIPPCQSGPKPANLYRKATSVNCLARQVYAMCRELTDTVYRGYQ